MKHLKKFNEGFSDLFKSRKQKGKEKMFKTQDLSKKNNNWPPTELQWNPEKEEFGYLTDKELKDEIYARGFADHEDNIEEDYKDIAGNIGFRWREGFGWYEK
tara:strand:- start:117023 stop:117328 length:306 start_codon:yes stop_codon:yes gene_type:complete